MRTFSYKASFKAGLSAVLAVCGLQAFNSFGCYDHSFAKFAESLGFIAAPMLPAIIPLLTSKPIRSVGASMLFTPWLAFAYYTDCGRPYEGGGASMIYVAVVLWGFPSALVGAMLTVPVARELGWEQNAA